MRLQKQGVRGNSFCWLPDLLTEPGPLKAFGKNGQRLIQVADRYLQMKPDARKARWDSMCMVRTRVSPSWSTSPVRGVCLYPEMI